MKQPSRTPFPTVATLAAVALAGVVCVGSGCGGASSVRFGNDGSLHAKTAPHVDIRDPHERTAPLVVSIVVDQLAAWVLDERLATLPADGGFARLVREGTRVRSMVYAHAVTDTAPGHAALYTGAVPRDSGIVANETVEADPTGKPGKRVTILFDPTLTSLSASGKHVVGSSGPELLLADGVSDRLHDAFPTATIVSVSLKDRGAVIPAGRHPTAALWFDSGEGSFVTSTAYDDHFPGWATALGRPEAVAKLFAKPWAPLDAAWLGKNAQTPDAQPGEADWFGLGTTFPHDVAGSEKPFVTFRATPYGDDAVLQLGLAAVDRFALGRGAGTLDETDDDGDPGDRPLLLAMSLSSNDYVSHVFGPNSYESWDELRRLDASLARFFRELDDRVGADKWTAILSADHGAGYLPEGNTVSTMRPGCPAPDPWDRPCGPLGRILPDEVAASLEKDARAALGGPPPASRAFPLGGAWVAGVADPYVIYGAAAAALPPARRAILTKALMTALARRNDLEKVYDVRQLPPSCPPLTDESLDSLVCHSYAPPRGGDLYLVAKPGYFFDPSVVVGKGESHGSPYRYDRTVPLLVRAPGRATAGRLVQTAPFGAFSRTLASLLGAPPPEASRNAPDLAGNVPHAASSAPAAASGLGKDGPGQLHSFTAPPE
jgi:hypothetical protein